MDLLTRIEDGRRLLPSACVKIGATETTVQLWEKSIYHRGYLSPVFEITYRLSLGGLLTVCLNLRHGNGTRFDGFKKKIQQKKEN